MVILTKFGIKDNIRADLTTEELFRNLKKKHKDETRISIKLKDFLRIFPNFLLSKFYSNINLNSRFF